MKGDKVNNFLNFINNLQMLEGLIAFPEVTGQETIPLCLTTIICTI